MRAMVARDAAALAAAAWWLLGWGWLGAAVLGTTGVAALRARRTRAGRYPSEVVRWPR